MDIFVYEAKSINKWNYAQSLLIFVFLNKMGKKTLSISRPSIIKFPKYKLYLYKMSPKGLTEIMHKFMLLLLQFIFHHN